jgi:hypothetical protein
VSEIANHIAGNDVGVGKEIAVEEDLPQRRRGKKNSSGHH